MRKVLRSVHVQTSARFEIPRKNNRHKTGFLPQTRSLWPAVKCLSLLSGGGKGYFFSVVLGLQSFSASSAWNARKVSNSQPKPLTIRNFPASSLEHLIFCQPARFLWGTDRVRNRFVGCPWNLWDLFGRPRGTYQSFQNYRGFSIIFPEILDAI